MRPKQLTVITAALMLLAPAAARADGPAYVPGEVVVGYELDSNAVQAAARSATGTELAERLAGEVEQLEIADGETVTETVAELEARPGVAYAVPNYLARASLSPNDPGRGGVDGWRSVQWNFLAGAGVDAPGAWDLAAAAGAPGARGVTVAVIDTGVAFERLGRFRRAPDLARTRFVKPYDFVGGDRHPNDENGHGTHVAGTIAQSTNNGVGVTGLAYNASVMPLRVLNAAGEGDSVAISRAIRYAATRGADVINLSLEFDRSVRASYIPEVISAIRFAHRRGVVVVAAAGNTSSSRVAYPARSDSVIAVGSTTFNVCRAEYSNGGPELDLVAPGGGADDEPGQNEHDAAACRPSEPGRFVFQETFTAGVRSFGLTRGYEGTSMATPHVSATAALLIASRRLGRRPSPGAVERRMEATARDIGARGVDGRYGAGLLSARAALAP